MYLYMYIQGLMVKSSLFKLLISSLFVSGFCNVQKTRQLCAVFEKANTLCNEIFHKFWNSMHNCWHWLRKLKSKENAEDSKDGEKKWEYHFDVKLNPDFFGDIHAMIDNEPRKSIWFTTKDVRVSEFLIWPRVPDDSYFSYNIRNKQFSSQAMKNKRKNSTSKLFNGVKIAFEQNGIWFFWDKKCLYQNQMVNSQNNHWLTISWHNVTILT